MGLFAQTYNAVRDMHTEKPLLWNILGNTLAGKPGLFSELQEAVLPFMWCDNNNSVFTQKCDTSGHPVAGSAPRIPSSYYSRFEDFMRTSQSMDRPLWHYIS